MHFPRLNPELSAGCIGREIYCRTPNCWSFKQAKCKVSIENWPLCPLTNRMRVLFPSRPIGGCGHRTPRYVAGGEWEINKLYQIEIFFSHEPVATSQPTGWYCKLKKYFQFFKIRNQSSLAGYPVGGGTAGSACVVFMFFSREYSLFT